MELRALINKMDQIESTKFLTEAGVWSGAPQSPPSGAVQAAQTTDPTMTKAYAFAKTNPEFAKELHDAMRQAKQEFQGAGAPTVARQTAELAKKLLAKYGQMTTEDREETKDSSGKVTGWKDEGEWKKSTKKDPRGRVTNLSDKARRDTEKSDKKEGIEFKSSIAQALLKEFNLEEAPIANPYTGADAAKFASLSPEDQEWLTRGGKTPDINDEIILGRAPNKGRPVQAAQTTPIIGQTRPQAPAAPTAPNIPAEQPGTSPFDLANMPPQGEPAAPAVPGAPGAQDDSTGVDAAVAAQQATKKPPIAGKPPAAPTKMTPAIYAYAERLGLLKDGKPNKVAIQKFQTDNAIRADGIIGPETTGAIISVGSKLQSGGGGARPAATQAGIGGKPAAATPVDTTKQSVSQRTATQPSLIDQGRARLGIPSGGTSPRQESITNELARIMHLTKFK